MQDLKPAKISDVIVHQIESLILDGGLRPGDRLPPERELAVRFKVSRPSLREAIKKLEARGLVTTRRGGGTYVSGLLDEGFINPLLGLFQSHPETLCDLVEMRHALEGVSAYYAALRGTEADRQILRQRFDAMNAAYHRDEEPLAEAKLDAEFHIAIAEAAHNVVLLYIMRALFNLLHSSISTSLEKLYTRAGANDRIHQQHARLFEAVMAGEPDAARDAAHEHLAYVKKTIQDIDEETRRSERARRRLQALSE